MKGETKMKTCVFTVIYTEKYLDDYLYFFTKQTCQDFDFLFVNEGIDITPNELDRCKQIFFKGTIAENRVVGLDYAKKHYDYLVFADQDDYPSFNRVEESVRLLNKGYDIVTNELIIVDKIGNTISENVISQTCKDNIVVDKKKDPTLLSKNPYTPNIYGFGNTAVNLHKVKKNYYNFPRDGKILDRMFYTPMISDGNKAVFTKKCCTYYRQYEGQILGWKLDEKRKEKHEKTRSGR